MPTEQIRNPKPFRTYSQQLDSLIQDKGLVVNDRAAALDTLRHISYFALISGYKRPFRENGREGKYREGVRFEDIVNLYKFDVRLSAVYLRHLLTVERHLKSLYGYHFAKMFGETEEAYTDPANYEGDDRGISYLIRTLTNHANNYVEQEEHDYIDHYQRNYKSVPIWVLMHAVTFGELQHMFEYAKPQLRDVICTELPGMKSRDLARVLQFLVRIRNTCAHAEPLYDLRTRDKLPVLGLHRSLGLESEDGTCTPGRRDAFGALIAIRYLVPGQNTEELTGEIETLMDRLFSKDTWITREQLTELLGFPENWKEVATAPLKTAPAETQSEPASAG